MLAWGQIILLILQIAGKVFDYAVKQGYIKEGQDREIAHQTAAILARTQAGKAMMEKVNAMSDEDVDAGLSGLEPK